MGVITLGQAAAWCGGQIDPKYKDVTFLGANMDTRKLEPGQLFLALQGARDGHDFVPAAMEKGAAAVLCSRPVGDLPAIIVEDVRLALGKIAQAERQRIGMKVLAVTGSVGKSTTKEMAVAILQTTYRTAKTPVNHNNDLGMPMAILAMPEDTQVAVLEMGMNHFREIAYLTDIAKPDLGIIVNAGTMHIENLGTMEGILQAKLELLEGMQPGSTIILNGDDSRMWDRQELTGMQPVYFGVKDGRCDLLGMDITYTESGMRFVICSQREQLPVTLSLEGDHFVPDALAAVAAGLTLGVSSANIQKALAEFQNMAGRQEIYTAGDYTIIKDCYNAGPESMAAALDVLSKKNGRRVAVLGDMLELGISAQAEHYKIGRIAAEKADIVLAYGPNSSRILSGAITGGMPETCARAFTDRDRMIAVLKQLAMPGDVILFKGSRGMRMELVLEGFLQKEEDKV